MAQQENRRGRESIIAGKESAAYTVILFHGYTGSPGDFGDLPEILATSLNARVVVPLLPGHGTFVEDLLPLDFNTFLRAAENETARIAQTGHPFAIGGHSFGAYLAILTTAQYKPSAFFTSVIPYRLLFPYSSFVGRSISRTKTLWTKHLPKDEQEARSGDFFYPQMPGKALSLVYDGNRRIEEIVGSITCPALAIHALHDTLAHWQSAPLSLARIPHSRKETLIIENGRHSIFASGDDKQKVFSTISNFLERSFASKSYDA